jgi:hypothetical protein
MKNMQVRVGILALAIVSAIGCSKGDSNNTPTNNNEPEVASKNVPEATNSQPANNTPEANNSPDTNKSVDTNSPTTATKTETKPLSPKEKLDKLKKDLDKTKPVFADVSKPGTDHWTKTQIAAKTLAETVDARMKRLKNNKMNLHLVARIPEGDGSVDLDSIVADSSRYLIRYAVFNKAPNAHFESEIVAQQNGKDTTLVGDKYQPGRTKPSADNLNGWVLNSTHYIVSGIGTSNKPFTDLVMAAQKAKWSINVETKRIQTSDFNRIIMESPTEPKKRYEIIVHPGQNLPVAFNADVLGKKKSSVSLKIGWAQSDTPITADQLLPKVKTENINVLTPEQAKKQGIKVPEKPKA